MDNEIQAVQYVELAPGTIASDYALKELNKALGNAQNEFELSERSELNPYFGYKYTPLISIISAVRPALTKHHLTVSQFATADLEQKTVTIYTRIVHWDSGEWMQNAHEFPAELALGKDATPRFNQQSIGGSETYGMKYAYKAIVGIADSEEMIDSTEEKGDLPSRGKGSKGITTSEFVAQKSTQQWNDKQKVQQATQAKAADPVHTGIFLGVPPDLLTFVPVKAERKVYIKDDKDKTEVPYVEVFFNGRLNGWNAASCWHKSLHDILAGSAGIEIQIQYKLGKNGRPQIEDVIFVNGIEYFDGKPKPEGALVSRTDDEIPF